MKPARPKPLNESPLFIMTVSALIALPIALLPELWSRSPMLAVVVVTLLAAVLAGGTFLALPKKDHAEE